ncbi:MAG: hypothetical protein GX564_02295, partial [Oligosphaeraceae bacterium]|nr:hypothetical protein [Oligosphaeraceae bacterium]
GLLDVGEKMYLSATCTEYYRASWRNAEGTELSPNTAYSPYVSNVAADNVIELVFVPTYKVVISKTPDPGGGYLSLNGVFVRDLGTPLSFYAGVYSNEFWQFIRWQENDSTASSQEINPPVSGTYNYTAEFQRYVVVRYDKVAGNEYYAGSFTGSEGLSGRSGSKYFLVSDTPRDINITAVPDEGFRFKSWTDEVDNATPTDPLRTLSISTEQTVLNLVADFVRIWVVSIGVKPGCENWGQVTQGTMTDAVLDVGTVVHLEAQENPGCQFVKWSDGSTDKVRDLEIYQWFGNTNIWAEFTSTAEINISIQEGQQDWGCQAGVLQADGTIVPSGNYGVGLWHTIKAIPAPNHRFVRWSDGYTSATRSLRLAEEGLNLTAEFAQTFVFKVTFKTDPEELPEGITLQNPYCYIGTRYCYSGVEYILDVGEYNIWYRASGDWVYPVQETIVGNIGDRIDIERTFTLITAGTIRGYLSPDNIGGAWRVQGETLWRQHAEELVKEAGTYTLEYKDVVGWLTPFPREVTVLPNRYHNIEGKYQQIVPGVELSFAPAEVSEGAGPNATIATLSRVALAGNPIDLSKTLTVRLSLSESNSLILPSWSIVIPAGRSFTQFPVGVVDNVIMEDFILDKDDQPIARGREVILRGQVAMSYHCNCSGNPTDGQGEKDIAAVITIWDNDSPALLVALNPSTMPESDDLYLNGLTVTRNDEVPGDQPLTVEITAALAGGSDFDDGTEIQFWTGTEGNYTRLPFLLEGDPTVSVVTIPAFERSVSVHVKACKDGQQDGNKILSVFADAQDYSPGSGWVMISDLSFPDYLISAIATPEDTLESDSDYPLAVTLKNNGNMDAPAGLQVPVAIHATRSSSVRAENKLLNVFYLVSVESPLAVGDSITQVLNVPLDHLAPANDWRFCAVVNPEGALREVSTLNNQGWSERFAIEASYHSRLDDLPPGIAILPGQNLTLSGTVTRRADDPTPVPNADVDVYLVVDGYRRVLEACSDIDGRFSVLYEPLASEIGQVVAGACYPGTDTSAMQQQFDVLGFRYYAAGVSYLRWDVTSNSPKDFSLKLRNPNLTPLTGLDGEIRNVRSGVDIEFLDLPAELEPGQEVTLNYRILAESASVGRDYERPLLAFFSNEGAEVSIPVYFFAIPQFAQLSAEPVSINTTMQVGVSRQVEVTLANTGAIGTGPVTISIPALSWMSLPAGNTINDIAPNESVTFAIQLQGDDSTPLNAPLSGRLAVNAQFAQHGLQIPFTVTAVSDATGNLKVSAIDEGFYYENPDADPNKKLAGAVVTVKNPYTGKVLASGVTEAHPDGVYCLFNNLPVGLCQVLINAEQHEGANLNVSIAPGATEKVETFLSFQAITYTWEVVQTEIEDQYEVVLNVVYATNVPMPVVKTVFPSSFADMLPGEVRMVNAVLTNQGLINANEVKIEMGEFEDFTFTISQPPDGYVLLPQQSCTIPVVVSKAATAPETRGVTRTANCRQWIATVYYYECGKDFKWHKFTKEVDMGLVCPRSGGGLGGGYSPGVSAPGVSYANVYTPVIPNPPAVEEQCVPCAKGLLIALSKCILGFAPGVGCLVGIMDALSTFGVSWEGGFSGWAAIITNGSLAVVGCAAQQAWQSTVGGVLGCISGALSICDGLDGKPPLPFPIPGYGGFSESRATRGITREAELSWIDDAQGQLYWGYRGMANQSGLMIEWYGSEAWLECNPLQFNAFNAAFNALAFKPRSPEDPRPAIVDPADPSLLVALPENLTTQDLADL